MTELKPCLNPKCDIVPASPVRAPRVSYNGDDCHILCPQCFMRGPRGHTKAAACEAWDALPREHERPSCDTCSHRYERCEVCQSEPVEPEHKCPHCKRPNVVARTENYAYSWKYYCRTTRCFAVSPQRDTPQEAYDAWWEPFKNSCVCVMCSLRSNAVACAS